MVVVVAATMVVVRLLIMAAMTAALFGPSPRTILSALCPFGRLDVQLVSKDGLRAGQQNDEEDEEEEESLQH